MQEGRVFRSMQTSAPFPPGVASGQFMPLTTTYPVVKNQPGQSSTEDPKRKNWAMPSVPDSKVREDGIACSF